MPRLSYMTEETWGIVERAKAIAQAEGAGRLSSQHLFRACCAVGNELVLRTLHAAGASEEEAASNVRCIAPDVVLPEGELPPMEVDPEGEAILSKAKEYAEQHPGDAGGKVMPIHLWAGVCARLGELGPWLEDRGWAGRHIAALNDAARMLLPPRRSMIKPAELRVLKQYCHRHLTELARQAEITPAYGVDELREQMVLCLLRKDKRSIVLTGPAGVGKTKLAEDLAVRIAQGEVPEMRDCEVFELDLALFTRGTHHMGSRGERWAELTSVLRAHADRIILFIDELHTVVGLPLEGRAMDLANVLKPLLVNDRVRIIGATTPEEYRQYIDADRALARRFTEIRVTEPDKDSMLKIMREVAPHYERHHQVKYPRDTLESIYELARNYLPNQAFPSKAVDLVDEVGVIARLRARRDQDVMDPVQKPVINSEDIRRLVTRKWGVESTCVPGDLAALMKEKVVGQDHAIDELADAIILSSAGYTQGQRKGPRALLLFLGPPGVGKSYTAQVLSDILFPGRDCLLTLDMTEFSGRTVHAGEHARWRLVGPPPPYVGWETGGVLTNHALQHPMSVVLVDEFEKAHEDARNIFLRIFDDGWIQDGRGRVVSFRGVFFILTANAGRPLWDTIRTKLGFHAPDETEVPVSAAEHDVDSLKEELRTHQGWAPELLSRIPHVTLFNALGRSELAEIARLQLAELRERMAIQDLVLLEYEDELAEWLVDRCKERPDCRRLAAVLEALVETPLAYWRIRRGDETLLKLSPGANKVEITAEETSSNQLFQRVAEIFAQREDQDKRRRQTKFTLGVQ